MTKYRRWWGSKKKFVSGKIETILSFAFAKFTGIKISIFDFDKKQKLLVMAKVINEREYKLKIGRFLFKIWVDLGDVKEFGGYKCYRVTGYEYRDVTSLGKGVVAWGIDAYTDEEFMQNLVSFICRITLGKKCSYRYVCVNDENRIIRVVSQCPTCNFDNVCDIDSHLMKCRNCKKWFLIR